MGTIISLFLTHLPSLIQAAKSVPTVVTYIKETKAALEQSKEWTEAEEAEFDKHVEEVTSQPWWTAEKTEG